MCLIIWLFSLRTSRKVREMSIELHSHLSIEAELVKRSDVIVVIKPIIDQSHLLSIVS